MVFAARLSHYCGLICAALTMSRHFSPSDTLNRANVAGSDPTGLAPRPAYCVTTLGWRSARAACSDSLATMAGGVPLGAHRPYQVLMSKPGNPDSAIVGTSGSSSTRRLVVTATARSLPDLMKGMADGMESNIS